MQEAAITRELQAAEEAGAGGAASRLSSLLDRGLVRLVKRDYDAAREVSACMYVRAAAQPEHDVERGLLRRTMKKRVCACLCVRSCVRAFFSIFGIARATRFTDEKTPALSGEQTDERIPMCRDPLTVPNLILDQGLAEVLCYFKAARMHCQSALPR